MGMGSVQADFVAREQGSLNWILPLLFMDACNRYSSPTHWSNASICICVNPRYLLCCFESEAILLRTSGRYFASVIRYVASEQYVSEILHLTERFNSIKESTRRSEYVMHPHERPQPGHARKYSFPESSEVAALIVIKHCGKMDIALSHLVRIDKNGNEKLDFIHLGHRMYNPLACPLIFPYGSDEWDSKLLYLDSKSKLQNFSPFKFYSRLLYQRRRDLTTLIHIGRLLQQFLC